MTVLRAQVRLPWTTGAPSDVTVNTWHFDSQGTLSADITSIHTALTTLYTGIDNYLSNIISTVNATIRYYNLGDPEPRVPAAENVLVGLTPATGLLPPEVALCGSFAAAIPSGGGAARRRGRIYFGPMAPAAYDSTTGRPQLACRTTIRDALAALLSTSQGNANWEWGVYSRVDSLFRSVVRGWVDDEFDTVRRRGRLSTVRSTF